jgi:hypothetical protein
MGVPWVPESYFYTERKWNELLERLVFMKVPFGLRCRGVGTHRRRH